VENQLITFVTQDQESRQSQVLIYSLTEIDCWDSAEIGNFILITMTIDIFDGELGLDK